MNPLNFEDYIRRKNDKQYCFFTLMNIQAWHFEHKSRGSNWLEFERHKAHCKQENMSIWYKILSRNSIMTSILTSNVRGFTPSLHSFVTVYSLKRRQISQFCEAYIKNRLWMVGKLIVKSDDFYEKSKFASCKFVVNYNKANFNVYHVNAKFN